MRIVDLRQLGARRPKDGAARGSQSNTDHGHGYRLHARCGRQNAEQDLVAGGEEVHEAGAAVVAGRLTGLPRSVPANSGDLGLLLEAPLLFPGLEGLHRGFAVDLERAHQPGRAGPTEGKHLAGSDLNFLTGSLKLV